MITDWLSVATVLKNGDNCGYTGEDSVSAEFVVSYPSKGTKESQR